MAVVEKLPEFGIGLVRAVGDRFQNRLKDSQERLKASQRNEDTMTEQLNLTFDEGKRRESEISIMTSALQDAYEQLNDIVTKRLRSKCKGGECYWRF